MSDNTVQNYGWKHAQALPSGNYITPQVLSLLKQIKARRVMDLGSGNGAMCSLMSSEGYSVVGCEYDQQGCELARQGHPGIAFYNLGVQDDPAAMIDQEGLFDAVTSTEVIEHLYSPHLLPQFARKCLKPGGHLIISTPYHGYLKNLALAITGKWDDHHTPLWHGGHIKFWCRRTLTELLESNGFEVLSFHGVGRAPYLWKSMILVAKPKQFD